MTQIICRIDLENKPVVFIADSANNGKIKAWHDGDEKVKPVSLEYYQSTRPLSETDSKTLSQRYAKAMKDDNVHVRQRLPRVYKTIPDVLHQATQAAINEVATPETEKKPKSNARSEAAKRRWAKELQQTTDATKASNEQAIKDDVPMIKMSQDDPRFIRLVHTIAEILSGKV